MRCSLVLALILVCLALTRAGPNRLKSPSQITDTTKLKFGDIVSMPTMCGTAKHFAIYVGNEAIEGISRNLKHNFFHRQNTSSSECVFTKIQGRRITKEEKYELTTNTTKEEMIKRLKEKVKDCGEYDVFTNNCEHTVTYIRFGQALTLQDKTLASWVKHICTGGVKNCIIYDEMVKNAKEWEKCVKDNNNV